MNKVVQFYRLERVFRVLLERNAITVDDMDILWNAQREKHDVIQRDVHDLIAKLVNVFNNVLQEHLFQRMKVQEISFLYVKIIS